MKDKQSKQYNPHYSFRLVTGILGGMALLLTLQNNPLQAAVVPERDSMPSIERLTLPKLEDTAPTQVLPSSGLPSLPELPPIPQDEMSLSAVAQVVVEQFQFEGNNVFTDEELAEITKDYRDREISAEQLQEVKNKITALYITKGYINSGAIIPDQKVANGIVKIQIIEGKLFRVDVENNKKLRTSYIEKRLIGKEGSALNIEKLQDRLQMLQQNPRFKRINAELGPGVKLGEGILKIRVEEAPPNALRFSFNNHRSPSVGAYRGQFEWWHRNVTGGLFGLFGKEKSGWGDTFYLRYGLTRGLNDFSVKYDIPLNRYDTTLSFNVERSDSEVVEFPFNQLDVESEADTYAITLRHSLQWYKKPAQSLDLALRLEKRRSKTFLLGRPFSFSPGVDNGESDLSVIRFSQDWLKRSPVQVIAARSSFNFGIDALDSTINEDGSPDSQFFTWLGQFQYVRRLNFLPTERLQKSQIIFRVDFQGADQDLLPLEKLSIGGASTVRGYRENYLTRDNGLISSLEWRVPILHLPLPQLSKNPDDGQLELAPFIDYGRAWNADSDTPDPKDIYSIGLGLRWSPSQYLHTQLYWGHALRDIPDPDDKDLQDDGVHFELSLQYPFD